MRSLWAYVHPASMLPVIALGAAALREGLALRTARGRRRGRDSRRHRRLARLFVLLLLIGYADGLRSMHYLRGEALFGSVHAVLVTGAAGLGIAAGGLGLALERGRAAGGRSAHALLGAGCVLLALGSALAGVALLS